MLQWRIQREATSREQADRHKVRRSPDWGLQLDSMKSESLVIVDRNATVNTFPGLVHTARHTMGVGSKEVGSLTFGEGAYHFVIHDWGEVVTR